MSGARAFRGPGGGEWSCPRPAAGECLECRHFSVLDTRQVWTGEVWETLVQTGTCALGGLGESDDSTVYPDEWCSHGTRSWPGEAP